MSTINSTYYSLTKVRDQGPEAKDWAATDTNFEVMSLIAKALEQHTHTGATAIQSPGYYTPLSAPTVTPQGTAGTTTYSYYVVARGTISKESPTGTTLLGNATPTGSNFNRITWSAVSGATGYDVIRVTGNTTQGRIATNLSSGTLQFDDTGIAAVTYVPIRAPTLTEVSSGGILPPGGTLGVRTSYVDALGLETQASPENVISLTAAAARPLAPVLVSKQVNNPGLAGGTYIYTITKKKGSGETVISDVIPVEIPYDSTYSVTLSFDAINTYSDGTTGINIYRSAGYDSAFLLVTTISVTTTTTFTDTNTIAAQNASVQPPATNTFDASKKVTIDWSAVTPHPAAAAKMRVYVTQQSGIWSTNHLLTEFDLTGSPPTLIDYLGSEALSNGWPKDTSQIPSSPPKLNLGTQATGAPTLTANMDLAGFQALNFRAHNNAGVPASPTNGFLYYDTSINNMRAFINGAWVNWGVASGTGYTHPAEEAGGHVAANIKFQAGSTITSKTVFDRISNPSTGARKQVTKIVKATPTTSSPVASSTSATLIPELDISGLLPDFDGQYLTITLEGHFIVASLGANISVAIEYDGSTIEETVRTQTAVTQNQNVSFHTEYSVVMGTTAQAKTVRGVWWTSAGSITAYGLRRSLVTEIKF